MKKFGNEIQEVLAVDADSHAVTLRFDDGTVGQVSLAHLFDRPKGLTADILKGGMFSMCFLDNGALAWPNGFELCPDALRARSISDSPRGRVKKASAPRGKRSVIRR